MKMDSKEERERYVKWLVSEIPEFGYPVSKNKNPKWPTYFINTSEIVWYTKDV
jgi:hypothetical protein